MSLPPEPYEVALLGDVKRMLEQIRTSNGFHTDAGEHVFIADERVDPLDSGITLIVDDNEEDLLEQDGYRRHVSLRLDVQVFVQIGQASDSRATARDTARRVCVDVRRALLSGLKSESFRDRPVDVRLEGRALVSAAAGAAYQVASQPVVVQMLEEFQST